MSGMTAVVAAAEAMAVRGERTTPALWLAQNALHETGSSGYANQTVDGPADEPRGSVDLGLRKLQRLWTALWRAPPTPADQIPAVDDAPSAACIDGDVARELANSLTVIAGNIRLALNGDGMDESARARLLIASTAARRALDLASGLVPAASRLVPSSAITAGDMGRSRR